MCFKLGILLLERERDRECVNETSWCMGTLRERELVSVGVYV